MSAAAVPHPDRLIFANQLRGAAALMVLLVHFTVVLPLLRPAVAWVVAAPDLDMPIPALATWMDHRPLDLAATGVGLFFLISGFVIPFSLEKATSPRFLLARAARIFPTFWAALLVECAAVHASGLYWGRSPPFGWSSYAINGLLIQTILDRGSVDWVSWTLAIEVKFYVLAALARSLVLRHGLGLALGTALAAYALNRGIRTGLVVMPRELAAETTFVAFILIGTMFHAHLARRLSTRALVAGIAVSMTLIMLCWRDGPLAGDLPGRAKSLSAALAIFATAYAGRRRFRPNRLLDGAARISYPLYLIHSVVGFTAAMFLTEAAHVPYGVAAPTAVAICVGTALALHRLVERPTMRWGHQVSRALPWTGCPLRWRKGARRWGQRPKTGLT